jgi:hypothetical protein
VWEGFVIQNPSDKDNMVELEQAMTWFGAGIEKGLALLNEDLESHDPYDPFNKPYSEKNVYFDRTNQYGGWLLTSGIYWAADIYYRRMLDKILEYEKSTSKYFNKGIVYANLGITQIAQGKFDAGIAHLLTAEWEDREIANPREFILDSILWKQFESKVFMYLIGYGNKYGINFAVDNLFLEKLFKDIDREDRIYLQGTILALLDNIELNKIAPNNFTYGRLYSMLKDLCLLIESLLHKKQTPLGNSQKDLYNLLKSVLKPQNVTWPANSQAPKATEFKQLLDQLEIILNDQLSNEIRWANCVYLVRNFTGHHFKVDETVKSTSGKSFFGDLYLPALENTFSLLLYLKYINAI